MSISLGVHVTTLVKMMMDEKNSHVALPILKRAYEKFAHVALMTPPHVALWRPYQTLLCATFLKKQAKNKSVL